MPKKRTKAQKLIDDYSILGIKVDSFKVRSSVSHNLYLRINDPGYAHHDDLAYEFTTKLEISGICTYPPERADDMYEISILGEEPHAGEFSATLRDRQKKDKDGIPMYKERRGVQTPVYEVPSGITVLNKVRGEALWTAYIHVTPRLVTDMLIQLTQIQPLYMYIDEHKIDRRRWIRDFTLQNSDPGEE